MTTISFPSAAATIISGSIALRSASAMASNKTDGRNSVPMAVFRLLMFSIFLVAFSAYPISMQISICDNEAVRPSTASLLDMLCTAAVF